MNGLSFQALPRIGVSFRYGGLGIGGSFAQGRYTWDRSFDAHVSILDEGKYIPAISLGLRDFIGTGWYSSEYVVGTKSIGNLEITAGLGFGRLAGRHSFSNPLRVLSSRFEDRQAKIKTGDRGGTLGNINWFHGDAAAFYGIQYHLSEKITLSSEYTPDIMSRESEYLDVDGPWNYGVSYRSMNTSTYPRNICTAVSCQLQRTSLLTWPASTFRRERVAPVPMRLRVKRPYPYNINEEAILEKF